MKGIGCRGYPTGKTILWLSLGSLLLLMLWPSSAFGVEYQVSGTKFSDIQGTLNNAAPNDVITVLQGVYQGDAATPGLIVNKDITLRGNGNPQLLAYTGTAPDYGGTAVTVDAHNVVITGFTIQSAPYYGIDVVNSSPFSFYYNNFLANGGGVNANVAPSAVYAKHCYWGDNGLGANTGKPGESGNNNLDNAAPSESYWTPWATAKVTNGQISFDSAAPYSFDNTFAGVKVDLASGSAAGGWWGAGVLIGSAAYQSQPAETGATPGTAARYVDVSVEGYTGGTATVTISYTSAQVVGLTESTLTPYVWDSATSSWVVAGTITRDTVADKVSGTFSTSYLMGSPIALVCVTPTTIQGMIDIASAGDTVHVPAGTYNTENVIITKPITLIGDNGPVVSPSSGDIFTVMSSGVTISGFTITGTSGNGVTVYNDSPRLIYNNIYGNTGYGVFKDLYNAGTVDARYCFWGSSGTNADRGKPGISGNSVLYGSVLYDPWVTSKVTNGKVAVTGTQAASVTNIEAGIDLLVVGGTNSNAMGGTARYLLDPGAPYGYASLSGTAVKYFDAFVDGNTGGVATITARYADTDLTSVTEDSLKLYAWDGVNWLEASENTVYATENKVTGKFSTAVLTGTPIALAGQDYSVTILPAQTPAVPITSKPVFTTFRVESTTNIGTVYYQLDNYASTGWKAIQSNVNAKTWNWPGWSMTDDDWASLCQGTHTIYFMFTRSGSDPMVGDAGEISWQFFKSTQVSLVSLLQPNGGETLTRQPYTIMWTLPSTDNVASITLTYSRDGGVTYPYTIARLTSAATSYSWRSPNIGAKQARVKVTVRYTNGVEYSDTSDADFTINKGYSFMAWKPDFGGYATSFRAWLKPPYSFRIGG